MRPIRHFKVAFALTLLGAALAAPCEARVVKLVVDQRAAYLGGAAWGNVGAYDKITGTASIEIDPADARDAVITDLDNAPRTARGTVAFTTPFVIFTPANVALGNHKLFFAVNNRGNNLEGLLTATSPAAVAATDAGAAMARGYTVVDAGWEGDIVPAANKLIADLPIAAQADGQPITGTMRYEYYDRADGSFTTNLEGTPAFRSYPAADTDPAHARLTVRDSEAGKRVEIPATQWAFGACPTGKASLVPGDSDLCYFPGFDSRKIYELIYTAKNPIVLGLGFAAIRDLATFLRHDARDEAGNANPLGGGITRAYAAGGSQTGGYLRDFIYLGFNEDESGRKVFDGVMPWIAGTDRVLINVRFADPNAYSEQDHQHDYLQNSYPPFTYAVATDPISHIRDGILKRPSSDPLVMQIDSESEFWQLHDSLNVIDGLGNPVPIPPNARLYFVGNTAHGFVHGGFRFPATGANPLCADATPTSGASWETLRAALIALDLWADKEVEPPPSNYPSIAAGTLATLADAAAAFPAIPGAGFPAVLDSYEFLNLGPDFGRRGGVVTNLPPRLGATYKIFVPKTDDNGLARAGVHAIEARVPVGTSTGWNIRAPSHRGPDLCSLTGAYFPLPRTREEKTAKGDPRPSLQDMYGSHAGFVAAVRLAGQALVTERFLLPEDAQAAAAAAETSDVLK